MPLTEPTQHSRSTPGLTGEESRIRGTLPTMTEIHLTFGAHMLLWGFPLVLTVLVAVAAIRDRNQSRGTS